MNQENIIGVKNLTKTYGKNRGIIDINLDVHRGEVFGYLGPNGAGKTTTIRLLLDFIRPSSGSATIFGLDTRQSSVAVHRRLGYLPGELAVYSDLTGEEFLKYIANLRGDVDWHFVDGLVKRLEADLKRKLRTLSHGNRQKIGLIQAFMHQPELVMLDEPTTGLDPLMQQEFYRLVEEVKARGGTVFLSSHIIPEVERVCDRVGIIREGRLVAVETIDALKSRAARRLEIHFAGLVDKSIFAALPGIRELKIDNNILSCSIIGSLDTLIKTAARYEVVNVISRETSLEDVFLTYYAEEKKIA